MDAKIREGLVVKIHRFVILELLARVFVANRTLIEPHEAAEDVIDVFEQPFSRTVVLVHVDDFVTFAFLISSLALPEEGDVGVAESINGLFGVTYTE